MAQPRGHRVDVQAALQPVAGAAVAQAVGGRALDAGPGGAACNRAFAIPSAIQRAALLGDSGLPPRPVNTLSAGLR